MTLKDDTSEDKNLIMMKWWQTYEITVIIISNFTTHGYQCDKAVNKNDTREVIWYHSNEWNDIISLHGFELCNQRDCMNLGGPMGLHVIF